MALVRWSHLLARWKDGGAGDRVRRQNEGPVDQRSSYLTAKGWLSHTRSSLELGPRADHSQRGCVSPTLGQ